ncbi:acyl-CoA dehydrogenase family protein [Streptomyces sp. NBC_00209]|uniref:acyl-CoA dehydrogenase family protein n=1 Tax=Streptomyces sp. NBC_00209 TaxID=2975682 RepID=UPI002F90CE39
MSPVPVVARRRPSLTPVLRTRLRTSAALSARSGEPDRAAVAELRASGLLAVAVSEAYGGAGGRAADVNRMVEEVAVVNPSLAIIAFQHCSVAARIGEWGSAAQKAQLLPRLADGTWLAASAWSEGGGRPGSGGPRSTAVREESGGWVLHGAKAFTTGACLADVYLVQVRDARPAVEPAPGGGPRPTFFVVPARTEGLVAELGLDLAGMRGSATGTVSLTDCRVRDANRLGAVGAGQEIVAGAHRSGAGLGAVAVGIAQAALDEVTGYAHRHGLMGRQSFRYRLAELTTRLEAARAMVERAGAGTAPRPDLATLRSKLFASTAAEDICLEAGRLMGSAGYASESAVAGLLADARGVALMGPSNELCHRLLAVSLLGRDHAVAEEPDEAPEATVFRI